MRKTRHPRLSRARALLARLSHRHRPPQHKHDDGQHATTPPSTPPTPLKHAAEKHQDRPTPVTIICAPLRSIPRIRATRARSDMHVDNQAMQERLAELEMIEMENSSLRLQVDDLQRVLDGVIEEKNNHTHVGELQMADIENSALRLQLECLRAELRRPFYGAVDVVDRRLGWLNVDAV